MATLLNPNLTEMELALKEAPCLEEIKIAQFSLAILVLTQTKDKLKTCSEVKELNL